LTDIAGLVESTTVSAVKLLIAVLFEACHAERERRHALRLEYSFLQPRREMENGFQPSQEKRIVLLLL
jgi:hypothetical protein